MKLKIAYILLAVLVILAASPVWAHERHCHHSHHYGHAHFHHTPAPPVIVAHDDNPVETPAPVQCPHHELLCE